MCPVWLRWTQGYTTSSSNLQARQDIQAKARRRRDRLRREGKRVRAESDEGEESDYGSDTFSAHSDEEATLLPLPPV
jgi:hypothetical protein